jgi:transcriptional regulator with XRE-family HTH domain
MSMTAEEIRELRRRLAMTQQQFSNKLGVSMSTVQKWEAGTSRPRGLSRRALRKLARKAPKEDTRLTAPEADGPADAGSEPPAQTPRLIDGGHVAQVIVEYTGLRQGKVLYRGPVSGRHYGFDASPLGRQLYVLLEDADHFRRLSEFRVLEESKIEPREDHNLR